MAAVHLNACSPSVAETSAAAEQSLTRCRPLPPESHDAWASTYRVEEDLVVCSQSLFRLADFGDYGLCGGGPDERGRSVVGTLNVSIDCVDEFVDAGHG